MSKKLAMERYYWFYNQLKLRRFPNARKLAERFEISHKQAQRDVAFIRDRLGVPVEFDRQRKGYELIEGVNYEFPPMWFGEEEMLAFLLAMRLASAVPDSSIKSSLNEFIRKFLSYRSLDSLVDPEEIQKKVSVKNIQYYRVDEQTFHTVAEALFRNHALRISYFSPHKQESTSRVIQPLHLLCYMGSWHLISFCTLRNALRDFALSRISYVEKVPDRIELPDSLPSIKEYIREKFGIFSGKKTIKVCLRFSPAVAGWVSEQIWHPEQETVREEDGSICLRFPVADLREVRREILKYGPDVEVLSPPDLRDEIIRAIREMAGIYEK
jgi:predicted DNA-binding transcriptional regulator YafY